MSAEVTRNWEGSDYRVARIIVSVQDNGNTSLKLDDGYGSTALYLVDAGGEWPVLRDAIDALIEFAQEQASEVTHV